MLFRSIGAGSGYYDNHYLGEDTNSVSAADSRAKAYWLGLHTELSPLDNLTVNFEGAYGRLNRANIEGFDGIVGEYEVSTSGWFLGMTADYSLDWATPGVFAWYGSGDRKNAHDSRRGGHMPILGVDGGSFGPTSFGTAGTLGVGNDSAVNATGLGTWGVGVQMAEMSFVEDLTHTLRFAYYRGTNNADIVRNGGMGYMLDGNALYLTSKDWAFEANFDHSYRFNDNLLFVLEMGYIHLKANKSLWEESWPGENRSKKDNAYKVEFNMLYEF